MAKYEAAIQRLKDENKKIDQLNTSFVAQNTKIENIQNQMSDKLFKKIDELESQVKDIQSMPYNAPKLDGSLEDQQDKLVDSLTLCLDNLKKSQSELVSKIGSF